MAELEAERASLREQLAELSTRVESMETMNDPNASLALKRLQLKAKELESKLELEQTTRARLEVSSFNIVTVLRYSRTWIIRTFVIRMPSR